MLHTNHQGSTFASTPPIVDLNQSCSIPRESFERAIGNRFPRLSDSFEVVASSRNRHAALYPSNSQSVGMLSGQRKMPPTEVPGRNGDNIGVADQHEYFRETFHGMRNPAVDPRKSRRHATDFGLGRCAESSLRVLNPDHQNSSKAISISVPIAMQDNTATDGDSVSSLFECSALDFPQPPPIGSPVIRRMCSSPWFADTDCMSEEFSNQESRRLRRSTSDSCDSCYSAPSSIAPMRLLHNERHNSSDMTTNAEWARLYSSPYLDSRFNDVSLEMVGEALVGLDMNASNLGPQELLLDNPAYGASSYEFSQAFDSGCQVTRSPSHLDWSTPSDLLRWSTSHRSQPPILAPMSQRSVTGEDNLQNDYRCHTSRTKTKPAFFLPSENQRSLGRLPRIIRKVASMRSDTRKPDANCIPLGSTGLRTIPKSRSFRSMSVEACNAGNDAYSAIAKNDGGPHRHRGWSFTNLDYFSSSTDAQDTKGPFSPTLNDSFRAFGHCKGRGTHMPLPSSRLGNLGSEAARHKTQVTALRPTALSGPFVHRETYSRPLAKTENNRTDKSFIDITPKQGTKHELSTAATKRARMKKLIARASTGIIGWGRQLTRKTSSVN